MRFLKKIDKIMLVTRVSENKRENIVPKPIIYHHDDFAYKKGCKSVDNEDGNSFGLNDSKRAEFFRINPLVELELLKEVKNPYLEEGEFKSLAQRDQKGELFLTYAIIKLLVENLIKKHKTKPGGVPYNVDNIFLINDSENELLKVLQDLKLKNNEDAKILYFDGVHGVFLYVRKVDGVNKCFIIEAMGDIKKYCLKIAAQIKKAFDEQDTIISSSELQNDWFSCTTFLYFILRFFCKYGDKFFAHTDKQPKFLAMGNYNFATFFYNVVKADCLMPGLYKLLQYFVDIKPEHLNTIVSKAKNQTLKEYLQQGDILIPHLNRKFRTNALQKRYALFEKAELILVNKLKDKFVAYAKSKGISLPDCFLTIEKINIYTLLGLIEKGVSKDFVFELCKFLYQNGYFIFHQMAKKPENISVLLHFINMMGEPMLGLRDQNNLPLLMVFNFAELDIILSALDRSVFSEKFIHSLFLANKNFGNRPERFIQIMLDFYKDQNLKDEFIEHVIRQVFNSIEMIDRLTPILLANVDLEQRNKILSKIIFHPLVLHRILKTRSHKFDFTEVMDILAEEKGDLRPLLSQSSEGDVLLYHCVKKPEITDSFFAIYRKHFNPQEILELLFEDDLSRMEIFDHFLMFRNTAFIKHIIDLASCGVKYQLAIQNRVACCLDEFLNCNLTAQLNCLFENNLVSDQTLFLLFLNRDLFEDNSYFMNRRELLKPVWEIFKNMSVKERVRILQNKPELQNAVIQHDQLLKLKTSLNARKRFNMFNGPIPVETQKLMNILADLPPNSFVLDDDFIQKTADVAKRIEHLHAEHQAGNHFAYMSSST